MRKRKKSARLLTVLLSLSMAFPVSTQMMEAGGQREQCRKFSRKRDDL